MDCQTPPLLGLDGDGGGALEDEEGDGLLFEGLREGKTNYSGTYYEDGGLDGHYGICRLGEVIDEVGVRYGWFQTSPVLGIKGYTMIVCGLTASSCEADLARQDHNAEKRCIACIYLHWRSLFRSTPNLYVLLLLEIKGWNDQGLEMKRYLKSFTMSNQLNIQRLINDKYAISEFMWLKASALISREIGVEVTSALVTGASSLRKVSKCQFVLFSVPSNLTTQPFTTSSSLVPMTCKDDYTLLAFSNLSLRSYR